MSSTNPSFATRLWAAVKGERSSRELEALRSAGATIYGTLLEAEDRRKELVLSGAKINDLSAAERTRFLIVWCAFTRQKLGESFLDADSDFDPGTIGFVPPITARQAQAFLEEVEPWLNRAERAAADSSYRLDASLPDELPDWMEVEPCPMAHLHAMIAACQDLVRHASIAVSDLKALGGDKLPGFGKVQAELAAAKSASEYASALHAQLHKTPSQELHERVERGVKRAIEGAYLVGQWAAMPELLEKPVSKPSTAVTAPKRRSGPGESGFDPWCLTDPATRASWKRDRAARNAIDALWRYDPDPAATLAVQAEIDAAEGRGDVERSGQGNYFCCPWSAIYRAINPVTIGGQRIRRGQTFTFDVSGEEMAEGGVFKREILVADFSPTSKVDYCNPEEGGHDDE